jgi:hypothetical protein
MVSLFAESYWENNHSLHLLDIDPFFVAGIIACLASGLLLIVTKKSTLPYL